MTYRLQTSQSSRQAISTQELGTNQQLLSSAEGRQMAYTIRQLLSRAEGRQTAHPLCGSCCPVLKEPLGLPTSLRRPLKWKTAAETSLSFFQLAVFGENQTNAPCSPSTVCEVISTSLGGLFQDLAKSGPTQTKRQVQQLSPNAYRTLNACTSLLIL